MNLVSLECPLCRGTIQVDVSGAGQPVACPLCQGTIQFPAADALAEAAPPPILAPFPPPLPLPPPMPLRGMPPVPMAMMSVACPSCGGSFQVPPSTAGMQLPCPACRQLVTIPSASSERPRAAEASEPVETMLPPLPQPVLLPPSGDRVPTMRDSPLVVSETDCRVTVRRLTPEERARRRAIRNLILFILGLATLLAFIAYQLR